MAKLNSKSSGGRRNSSRSSNKSEDDRGRSRPSSGNFKKGPGKTARKRDDDFGKEKRPARQSENTGNAKRSFTSKSIGRKSDSNSPTSRRAPGKTSRKRDDDFGNEKRTTRRTDNTDNSARRPFSKSVGRKSGSNSASSNTKRYGKSEDNREDKPPYKKSNRSETGERSSNFRKGTAERVDKFPPKRSGNFTPRLKDNGDKFASRDRSAGFNKAKRPRKISSDKKETNREEAETGSTQSGLIRLNKFIANSGVCSRREADELITMGLISVNGKTITELGYKVNPGDEVRHENKVLRAEKPVYILLNKPKGFLTTTNDPQERNTVMHLIAGAVKERVYPVGRLDRNTTGLLLLTNDGDLADKLMHPSYNVKKIYKVELDRPLTKADFERIQLGVQLEEGKAVVDDVAIVAEDGRTVGVELHIGWNRVVRRIFETLGYEVVKLDRSVYAGLDKKDLQRGHWRFLKQEEIVRLKHFK